jgi:hypothetical protein
MHGAALCVAVEGLLHYWGKEVMDQVDIDVTHDVLRWLCGDHHYWTQSFDRGRGVQLITIIDLKLLNHM